MTGSVGRQEENKNIESKKLGKTVIQFICASK